MPARKQPKGRIRHVALSVPGPWAVAEFYKETFGMTDAKMAEAL
jgi:catechol-2,3-dioxygenase